MLDSRFRQAMNLSRISVALLARGTWPHAIAHDEAESYFFNGVQDELVEHLCSDQHFLDTAELGPGACKEAIEFHTEECRAVVESLEPELFLGESDFSEQNTKKLASLGRIYVMCLQSKILLSEADGI